MAGLWDRTMTLFKSKWNKLLNRAENPAETLDYSYEKQLELLQNVKRGVADVVTAKKRLQLQADKLEASARFVALTCLAGLLRAREEHPGPRGGLERPGEDISAGCREITDPEARLRDMDKSGFDVQVIYPTLFLIYLTDDVALEVALKGAVPFGRPVDLAARYTGGEGRKAFASGEIVVDGAVVVSATSIYVAERR